MNTYRLLEERNLRALGETVQIRLRGQQTQGAFALICSVTPPQGGVPSHVHSKEDETFIVLEGLYEFRVGDSVILVACRSDFVSMGECAFSHPRTSS